MSSQDGCRARYDHLIFAAERCQAGGQGEAPSSERRWMLELGAMSVLEAEVETLRLERVSAGRVCGGGDGGDGTEQEQESYRSCLEEMLDDHYEALCEFRPPTIPSPQYATHTALSKTRQSSVDEHRDFLSCQKHQ